MLAILTTENSIYDVDLVARKVRRMASSHEPTDRQGPDGTWKPYEAIHVVDMQDGDFPRLFFDWDGKGHGTLTSPVTGLEFRA